MTRSWERWAPSLGILAVVCWIVAFAVAGSTPSTDDNRPPPARPHSRRGRFLLGFEITWAGRATSQSD